MPRIYALLVGINRYTAISQLHGCVADIDGVERLLTSRITEPGTLSLRVLRDDQATRAAIIDGFLSHLAQAGADDIALFYYCGHGSTERSLPEWSQGAIGGLYQTIVPVDARVGDTFDISDKELSALSHKVGANGAQVVTLFDSCHSGDAVRSATVTGVPRMAAASTGRARTVADYHELARALYDPAADPATRPREPRRIHLSACRDNQLAKEVPEDKTTRNGVFTTAFLEAASALGPSATYADIISVIRTRVRASVTDQDPGISVMGDGDAATVFLGGAIGRVELALDHGNGTWWLSSGAIDGIAAPVNGTGGTTLAIYPRGTVVEGVPTGVQVASATVRSVDVDRAAVDVQGDATLDTKAQYHCTITSLEPPALHVRVEGADASAVAALRTQLAASAGRYAVVEQPDGNVTAVTVQLDGTRATLLGAEGQAIGTPVTVDAPGTAALAKSCTHLARWYGLRHRALAGSRFNDKVTIAALPTVPGEVKLRPGTEALTPDASGTITLSYTRDEPPRVQLRLRNTSDRRLFVALFCLSDDFSCRVLYDGWMDANDIKDAFKEPVRFRVAEGAASGLDILKLVAADTEFMAHSMLLRPVFTPPPLAKKGDQTRGGGFKMRTQGDMSSWGTTNLNLLTRR